MAKWKVSHAASLEGKNNPNLGQIEDYIKELRNHGVPSTAAISWRYYNNPQTDCGWRLTVTWEDNKIDQRELAE